MGEVSPLYDTAEKQAELFVQMLKMAKQKADEKEYVGDDYDQYVAGYIHGSLYYLMAEGHLKEILSPE